MKTSSALEILCAATIYLIAEIRAFCGFYQIPGCGNTYGQFDNQQFLCPGNSFCNPQLGGGISPYCCQQPQQIFSQFPQQPQYPQPQYPQPQFPQVQFPQPQFPQQQTQLQPQPSPQVFGQQVSNNQQPIYSPVDYIRREIQSNKMMVFSKTTCSFCHRAREMLSRNYPNYPVKYLYFDEMGVEGTRLHEAAQSVSQMKTVPQIWLCNTLLGGGETLQNLETSGQLRSRMQSCFGTFNR